MNRTVLRSVGVLFWLAGPAFPVLAQGDSGQTEKVAQDADIKSLMDAMEKTEASASKIRLALVTQGAMPGGLEFETRGTLRVLRTEQGAATAVHSVVEYSFADGLSGRMESVRRPEGVWILETNPTFGQVYVEIDAELLKDLEWAGEVLDRDVLPGMGDSRSSSPLGVSMVADLARRYQLEKLSKGTKFGQAGQWYGGVRRPSPGGSDDADLPLADRVEVFVRDGDSALLEVVFLEGGKPVQRISAEELVIGEAMPLESFAIEAKDARLRDVREHPPMWEQIANLLGAAERSAEGMVRPSMRKKQADEDK